jgi:large subunit ribosomal protein L3
VALVMAAILGKKLGMTQVFQEDGSVVPVTVIEAGPCKVTAVRDAERDGYSAVQLAFGEVKQGKLTKAEEGHLKKAGSPPMRHLVEFRDEDLGKENDDPIKIGDDITVDGFEAGQKVKVAGISVGKGFQGGIKRHNFSRGPVSHGSHNVRAPGSIGASAFPARVFKGMRMPGQMGNKRVTQRGLEIADVDADRNLLLIKGSVPGSRNAIVEVRTDG